MDPAHQAAPIGHWAVRNLSRGRPVDIVARPRFPCRLVDAAVALRLRRWIEYRVHPTPLEEEIRRARPSLRSSPRSRTAPV